MKLCKEYTETNPISETEFQFGNYIYSTDGFDFQKHEVSQELIIIPVLESDYYEIKKAYQIEMFLHTGFQFAGYYYVRTRKGIFKTQQRLNAKSEEITLESLEIVLSEFINDRYKTSIEEENVLTDPNNEVTEDITEQVEEPILNLPTGNPLNEQGIKVPNISDTDGNKISVYGELHFTFEGREYSLKNGITKMKDVTSDTLETNISDIFFFKKLQETISMIIDGTEE